MVAETKFVPDWALLPTPVGHVVDEAVQQEVDERLAEGEEGVKSNRLRYYFQDLSGKRSYDDAVNHFTRWLWPRLTELLRSGTQDEKIALLRLADGHLAPQLARRIVRRFCRDTDLELLKKAKKVQERLTVPEVALPREKGARWDQSGWLAGHGSRVDKTRTGAEVLGKRGLPAIETVGELRSLLKIPTRNQLGWLLTATDGENSPYYSSTIPKRDGSERVLHAPKGQLRATQRRILRTILDQVTPHAAAHGFIRGRSTVTNATPHCGAKVILKFDLEDFFPTITFWRVVGLFIRLGFPDVQGRFQAKDDSPAVAATLARLCVHVDDPQEFGTGRLPQGAPTSPAITNLICRRLDARLAGLADAEGGTYTRYADDLTFSFREDIESVGRFRWWVDQVCHQEGFIVHQGKFRVIRGSQRQLVTGIVVNEQPRIPREERRKLRAVMHQLRTEGEAAASRGRSGFRSWLRGSLSYLAMVHPEEGQPLLEELGTLLAQGGEA